MAITNNDPYTTKQNVSITGSYMTFGSRRVLLTKESSGYNLSGICCVFKNEASKDSDFECLEEIRVDLPLAVGDLGNNLYTALYNKLKLTYTNSTDV